VEDAAAGQDRRADRRRLAWSSCRSRGAVSGLSVDGVGGTVGAGFDEGQVEGADLSWRGRDRRRRQVRRDSDQEDEDGERKKGQSAPHSYSNASKTRCTRKLTVGRFFRIADSRDESGERRA